MGSLGWIRVAIFISPSVQYLTDQKCSKNIIKYIFKIETMDLEWLLPEQIEQVLKLCDLSSIEDISFAASLLEMNHWNLQLALSDAVGNKDQILNKQAEKEAKLAQKNVIQSKVSEAKIPLSDEIVDDQQFEVDPSLYDQLGMNSLAQPLKKNQQAHAFSNIRHQQNKEYQTMQHNYKAKQAEEEEWNTFAQVKEKEFDQDKQSFNNYLSAQPIQIKFRLPSKIESFTFDKNDKIKKVYQYVNGHLRSGFENRYSEFDLCQTFQASTLKELSWLSLHEVFGDSTGEVIIVKEF